MTPEPSVEHLATVPPGRYWLGDPSYAFDRDEWLALMESHFARPVQGQLVEASAEGVSFLAVPTTFGDGVYLDADENEYPVDSGLVGLTLAREGRPRPEFLREVEFEEPAEVRFEEGRFEVGEIEIDVNRLAAFPGDVDHAIGEIIGDRLKAQFGNPEN